jgi:hypothetical protein
MEWLGVKTGIISSEVAPFYGVDNEKNFYITQIKLIKHNLFS